MCDQCTYEGECMRDGQESCIMHDPDIIHAKKLRPFFGDMAVLQEDLASEMETIPVEDEA